MQFFFGISENFEYFRNRLGSLKEQCRCELAKVGFTDDSIRYEPFLHMRYERFVELFFFFKSVFQILGNARLPRGF
uniref:Uncharacterized protein n=1 Tax=Ascaris lumbricoides TaxID=6252 RepID=A0A0M3HLQ3_ASCLU